MAFQLSALAAALSRPVRSAAPVVASTGASSSAPVLPVTLGGTRVKQHDPTTCGPTVLLMLAATGDPVLAEWLEAGRLPAAALPPEVPPSAADEPDGAARLRAAQQHLHAQVTAAALGPLPWPRSLGTPPWAAARAARFPGVRYRSVPIDDRTATAGHVLASVHAATLAGVPVPLYTGGDLSQGLAAAVPRHVVLAVPPPAHVPRRGYDDAGERSLHIFEPSSGTVRPVRVAELLRRTGPHPALGHWSHVCWVLLPEPVATAPGARETMRNRRRPGRRARNRPTKEER